MTWLGRKLGLDRFLDLVEPGTSTLTDTSLSEGGLLWFTDLMAADPYGGLPLICALTLGWSSWSRLSADRLKELLSVDNRSMNSLQRAKNALGRVLLVIPLFPLLFWNLPSAIFLYWAPTFLFNSINDTLLKKWLPDRQPRYLFGRRLKRLPSAYVSIEGYEIPQKQGGSGTQPRQPVSR
jgi:inner membrane protein COX18